MRPAGSGPGGQTDKTDTDNEFIPMAAPDKAADLWQELTNAEKLGKRGEAWFAAQVLALVLVAFPPAPLEGLISVLGVALVAAGGVLVFLGQRDLGRNLTPLPTPREEHSLVTDGIYGLVRHPMYGGLLLFGVGLASATDDSARFAMTVLLYAVLEKKSVFEEGQLQERYGQEYETYIKNTKKFIPYIL